MKWSVDKIIPNVKEVITQEAIKCFLEHNTTFREEDLKPCCTLEYNDKECMFTIEVTIRISEDYEFKYI